jgi:hypothetical protein
VGNRDEVSDRVRDRLGELRLRLAEVQERNLELADARPPQGSTPEQADRARLRAEQAQARALEAHRHASAACEESAIAHDAAATRHEQLADQGSGDTVEHRRRAREHRDGSGADRRIYGPEHV